MAENEELKSMPDPSQVGVSGEPESVYTEVQSTEKLPRVSALDPEMKVVKNYVRKTVDEAKGDSLKTEGTQKCPNCK